MAISNKSINFVPIKQQITIMARLKPTNVLRQKANESDVNVLIGAIEEVILKDGERGYEKWEKQVCVLPNYL